MSSSVIEIIFSFKLVDISYQTYAIWVEAPQRTLSNWLEVFTNKLLKICYPLLSQAKFWSINSLFSWQFFSYKLGASQQIYGAFIWIVFDGNLMNE